MLFCTSTYHTFLILHCVFIIQVGDGKIVLEVDKIPMIEANMGTKQVFDPGPCCQQAAIKVYKTEHTTLIT